MMHPIKNYNQDSEAEWFLPAGENWCTVQDEILSMMKNIPS